MQRKFRLTRSEDFKRVRRFGKSYAHPLVVLIVQTMTSEPRPVAFSDRGRVGVAAGRTVGTAVYRNRAKRLLREAMRTSYPKHRIRPRFDPDRPPWTCLCNFGGNPPGPAQSSEPCTNTDPLNET